ncbi:MAG TPA: S8 family serine peptidase [bacterium]|nr:S8 family serine peptidase [bacterium]
MSTSLLLLLLLSPALSCATRSPRLAVRLVEGADADLTAEQLGMINLGPVGELPGVYVFSLRDGDGGDEPGEEASGRKRGANDASSRAILHERVLWAEEQVPKARLPRGLRADGGYWHADPLYGAQWHLLGGDGASPHMNVPAAWRAGYDGSGVRAAVVDDGLQGWHPDLAPNYDRRGSHDYDDGAASPEPAPGDRHGTAVAGLLAAADDGAYCGVGVAFRANVSGVRLTARSVTDAEEAAALSHGFRAGNDVYSCSWGPRDDGATLDAPGPLATAAMLIAASEGRGGLGSVYVWAAGNGHARGDSCAYDGYAASRLTISVAAVTRGGRRAAYSERCAANFVSAHSSGGGRWLTTTDLAGAGGASPLDCRSDFGGTSAAAPLAAGVVALMLQANSALTGRDVQHVLAVTSTVVDAGAASWRRNSAGVWHSDEYGFGLVNAGLAAATAASWAGVPPQRVASNGAASAGRAIPDGGAWIEESARFAGADGELVVEWAEVELTASHPRRGDIELRLVSPAGTEATLAPPRPYDAGRDYDGWTFSACGFWGERAEGVWRLLARDRVAGDAGELRSWSLTLYGY